MMIKRPIVLQVLLLALSVCAYQVAQAYESFPLGTLSVISAALLLTLILQKTKRIFFKTFAVFTLAYVILQSSWWRAAIFDDRVFLPFLILLIAPTLFAVIRRENPIWALIACFVPAGVAVGVINLTVALLDMSSAEEAIASPVIYSPIALGLILSYVCRGLAPPYEYKPENTGAIGFGICSLVSGVSMYNYGLYFIEGADILLNLGAFFSTYAVILCCFAFNDKTQLSIGEVMAKAGLFTCLLGAVSMVTLYTAASAGGVVREVGFPLATSQLIMLYGALVLIAASASGIRPSTDRELITRDWHITEAYVFISLVVFPPLTLLEQMSRP